MNPILNAQAVNELFVECMVDPAPEGQPQKGVLVDIVIGKVWLDTTGHEDKIKAMLNELPLTFMDPDIGGGGGHSFLAACMDRNEHHWGEHRNIAELMGLGLASGYVSFCLPKQYWSALPGGMPYFAVHQEPEIEIKT